MAGLLTTAARQQTTPAVRLYFKGLVDSEIETSPTISCLQMELVIELLGSCVYL
jgi:hypothetical protein